MAKSRLSKLAEELAQGKAFEKAPDPLTLPQPEGATAEVAVADEPTVAGEMLSEVLGGETDISTLPPLAEDDNDGMESVAVSEPTVQPLKPGRPHEPVGMLPGDIVWYWVLVAGTRLYCEPARLRDQHMSGRWNLTVDRCRAPGIACVTRTGVPYSETPKNGHWTLRDPKVFYPEG